MMKESCSAYPTDWRDLTKPITSLISKSEKAQRNLRPGTWQHTMLQENLKALHMASALMTRRANGAEVPGREDLKAALRAFAAMTKKTEETKAKFASGTSQHTLQRNRLRSFRSAEALIEAELK